MKSASAISFLTLICFSFLSFPASIHAQKAQPLEIMAVVLSKTCPLPDSPDLQLNSPESIMKSAENPSCPRQGDLQLIQAAITNLSGKSQQVGFEFDVKVNNKTSTRKNMRKVIQVNALDTVRLMHEVMLDETGLYRVSVKLWDPQFKSLFTQTPIGEERQFLIASRTEIEEAQLQMTGGGDKGARRPISLQFDPPDLRWESAQVIPKHALRGERLRIRLNLMNVGGDIVQGTRARIEYFNTRQPRRKTIIGTPTAYVMAPGEVVTFDLEYVLPEDQLLGEYQVVAMVDPDDEVEENKEDNNEIKSNIIQLSDIKLLLPTDGFVFEENGLFLFQWDSLVFSEFKIQIGVDDQFEDGGAFFDLPQGDRWIADKEIVPLSGGLPGMAMGLMKSLEKNKLYWRVIGRKASGQQTISEIRTFSINPVTGGKQS